MLKITIAVFFLSFGLAGFGAGFAYIIEQSEFRIWPNLAAVTWLVFSVFCVAMGVMATGESLGVVWLEHAALARL